MPLDYAAALNFATVLDDTVNQLFILGTILPVSLEDATEAKPLLGAEIETILALQNDTQAKLEIVLTARDKTLTEENSRRERAELAGAIADGNRAVDQAMRQNPLTRDNFIKIQCDRQFCEDVLVAAQEELLTNSDFRSLLEAVRKVKQIKVGMQEIIIKEDLGRKKMKRLQKQLVETRKEREFEIRTRNEKISHLKDQLQEMKAKSNMEGKYVKKHVENRVIQTQQVCVCEEERLKAEFDSLRQRRDAEVRSHMEIDQYLRTHQHLLEEQVDYWMERYDVDVEMKTHQLSTLKMNKAHDWDRLQELTLKYHDCEKMVIENRINKERIRQRAEQQQLEIRTAIMLQAWWRHTLVKHKLGPFGKKKGKKGGKKKK